MQKVAEVYQQSFSEWMTNKNTKLRPNMFLDLSSRAPMVAFESMELMIAETRLSKNPRGFQLAKAFEIIASTIKSLPTVNEGAIEVKFVAALQSFSTSIIESLQKVPLSGPNAISKDRFKEIVKALAVVVRRCKTQILDKSWNTSVLSNGLEELKEHQYFKSNTGIQTICKQISAQLV